MKSLIGKTFAVTLIASLLTLASVENHAGELDSYLDEAMRTQVLEELKENMQRLYEGEAFIPATGYQVNALQVQDFGFSIANRKIAVPDFYRVGVVN